MGQTQLEAEIARIAPFTNTDATGEYTGDIYADDEVDA